MVLRADLKENTLAHSFSSATIFFFHLKKKSGRGWGGGGGRRFFLFDGLTQFLKALRAGRCSGEGRGERCHGYHCAAELGGGCTTTRLVCLLTTFDSSC